MRKYSVVIPMYNSEKTITNALNSIYQQTKLDLIDEIIVVDDGSNDRSYSIVEKYNADKQKPTIRLLKKENGGAASARNLGIKNAVNDFVALLDADDVWENNKIEIQNNVLEKNDFIKALGSNRKGETLTKGEQFNSEVYKISALQYCMKNWPCTPSIVFDRKVFNGVNPFPENMTHAEEGLFFLYLANNVGLYYCVEELVYCGDGKPSFGYSGLSGNLKKMHKGVKKMHQEAYKRKYFNLFMYYFVQLFEDIKYIRRKIIIQKTKQIRRNKNG